MEATRVVLHCLRLRCGWPACCWMEPVAKWAYGHCCWVENRRGFSCYPGPGDSVAKFKEEQAQAFPVCPALAFIPRISSFLLKQREHRHFIYLHFQARAPLSAAVATSHTCPLDTCHRAGSNAQDILHFEDLYEKGAIISLILLKCYYVEINRNYH